jgi:hypothetical protein
MRFHKPTILLLLVTLLMSACATTNFTNSGESTATKFCQAGDAKLEALIIWMPNWRIDQKDIPQREAAAEKGIHNFFAKSTCFTDVKIARAKEKGINELSVADSEIIALARAEVSQAGRALVISVRELGPILQINGPVAAFGGGTEVALEVRAIDINSGRVIGSRRTHWHNGGSFVIKGVKTLPDDMESALQAALLPEVTTPNSSLHSDASRQ